MEAFILVAVVVTAFGWCCVRINKEESSEKHNQRMIEERREQVYHFRCRMIYEFDTIVSDAMPSYQDMLDSDKPLIASEWVNVDKLVNLN